MNTFTPRNKRSSNGPEPSPADKYPEDSPVRMRPQANMPAQGINVEDTEAFPALGEAARLPRRARRSTFGSAPTGANPITPGGESHLQSSATVPRPTAHQMHRQQAPWPPVTQQDFIKRMRARSIRQPDFNISSALGRQQAQGSQGTNPTYAFDRLEATRQAQREATVAQLRAAFLEPQRSSSAFAATEPAAAGPAAPGEPPFAAHGLPPRPPMPPREIPSSPGHGDTYRDPPDRMASYMPRHTPTPGASFDRPGHPQPAMAFSDFISRSQDETRTTQGPAAQRAPLTSQPFRAPNASASRTNQIHPLDRPIQFTLRPAPAQRARPTILSGLGAYQALPQDINPDLAAYLATTGISNRLEAEGPFSAYDNRTTSAYNNPATSIYDNPATSTYDNPATYAPFYTTTSATQDAPAQNEPAQARAETLASFTTADYETTPPLSRPSSPDLDIQGDDGLTPDARPLSEDQVSGKKYGIEIGGIGSSLLNTSDRLKWMGATAEALVHTSGKDKVTGGQTSGGMASGGMASGGMASGATTSGYTTFGGTTSGYSTYGGTSLAGMTSSGIASTGMDADQVKQLWQPEQRPQANWNPPDQGRRVQSRLGGFMMKPREGDGWGGWKRVPKLEQKERERKEKEEREKKEKEEREKKGE